MREIVIKRIELDREEIPSEVIDMLENYWSNISKLIIDSDGQNYISLPRNMMYRIDGNIQGYDRLNAYINQIVRRDLKLNQLGI